MFKIEYLSSYSLPCRVYCVYMKKPLTFSPTPTFRSLKNMSALMLHFLMHVYEYRMT